MRISPPAACCARRFGAPAETTLPPADPGLPPADPGLPPAEPSLPPAEPGLDPGLTLAKSAGSPGGGHSNRAARAIVGVRLLLTAGLERLDPGPAEAGRACGGGSSVAFAQRTPLVPAVDGRSSEMCIELPIALPCTLMLERTSGSTAVHADDGADPRADMLDGRTKRTSPDASVTHVRTRARAT